MATRSEDAAGMGIRKKKEGLISQTDVKVYSLGIVTEIWMVRSQKSGGDLEIVGGGLEIKWKVKGLHKRQSCSLLAPCGRKF